MKFFLRLFALCFFLSTYGQKEWAPIPNFDLRNEIKNLQKFEEEPVYQIHIESPYSFTIFINGIPIANKYTALPSEFIAEINNCIPNSGKQSIEIEIYPRYINPTTQKEFLEEDIPFKLRIERTYWK